MENFKVTVDETLQMANGRKFVFEKFKKNLKILVRCIFVYDLNLYFPLIIKIKFEFINRKGQKINDKQ